MSNIMVIINISNKAEEEIRRLEQERELTIVEYNTDNLEIYDIEDLYNLVTDYVFSKHYPMTDDEIEELVDSMYYKAKSKHKELNIDDIINKLDNLFLGGD